MSEQVGQAKQVAEPPDRVVLFALSKAIMLLSQNSLAQRIALPAAFATICGCGIPCYAVGGSCGVGFGICVVGSVEHDVGQGAVAGSGGRSRRSCLVECGGWAGLDVPKTRLTRSAPGFEEELFSRLRLRVAVLQASEGLRWCV